ncbi:hypothetical protein JTE90_004458, partial [Oedothorax gibbosus]
AVLWSPLCVASRPPVVGGAGAPLSASWTSNALDGAAAWCTCMSCSSCPTSTCYTTTSPGTFWEVHYFLQLKCDILEGKLCCNEEQTILFASYSLQAEFGDHDPERPHHRVLDQFRSLTKHLGGAKEREEAVLERVIQAHLGLQGMSQQMAEVCYIREAQGINGYGLECFARKFWPWLKRELELEPFVSSGTTHHYSYVMAPFRLNNDRVAIR